MSTPAQKRTTAPAGVAGPVEEREGAWGALERPVDESRRKTDDADGVDTRTRAAEQLRRTGQLRRTPVRSSTPTAARWSVSH